MTKKPTQSRLIWVGVLTTLASTLGFLQGQEYIAQYPQIVAGLGAAVGILTVVLRLMTTKPIE